MLLERSDPMNRFTRWNMFSPMLLLALVLPILAACGGSPQAAYPNVAPATAAAVLATSAPAADPALRDAAAAQGYQPEAGRRRQPLPSESPRAAVRYRSICGPQPADWRPDPALLPGAAADRRRQDGSLRGGESERWAGAGLLQRHRLARRPTGQAVHAGR